MTGKSERSRIMGEGKIEEFQKERERLNQIVMKYVGTNIKRFFSID